MTSTPQPTRQATAKMPFQPRKQTLRYILALGLCIMLVGLGLLRILVHPQRVNRVLTATCQSLTHTHCSIQGPITWSFLPWTGLSIHHVHLGQPDQPHLARAHELDVKIDLLPLFWGQVRISGLKLVAPRVRLPFALQDAPYILQQALNSLPPSHQPYARRVVLAKQLDLEATGGGLQFGTGVDALALNHVKLGAHRVSLDQPFTVRLHFQNPMPQGTAARTEITTLVTFEPQAWHFHNTHVRSFWQAPKHLIELIASSNIRYLRESKQLRLKDLEITLGQNHAIGLLSLMHHGRTWSVHHGELALLKSSPQAVIDTATQLWPSLHLLSWLHHLDGKLHVTPTLVQAAGSVNQHQGRVRCDRTGSQARHCHIHLNALDLSPSLHGLRSRLSATQHEPTGIEHRDVQQWLRALEPLRPWRLALHVHQVSLGTPSTYQATFTWSPSHRTKQGWIWQAHLHAPHQDWHTRLLLGLQQDTQTTCLSVQTHWQGQAQRLWQAFSSKQPFIHAQGEWQARAKGCGANSTALISKLRGDWQLSLNQGTLPHFQPDAWYRLVPSLTQKRLHQLPKGPLSFNTLRARGTLHQTHIRVTMLEASQPHLAMFVKGLFDVVSTALSMSVILKPVVDHVPQLPFKLVGDWLHHAPIYTGS